MTWIMESNQDAGSTRRSLLRAGSAALLMGGTVGTATASNGQSEYDWAKFRQRMVERYGTTEGRALTGVIRREFNRARKRGLSAEARSDAVRSAIMSHSGLDTVQREIQAVEADRELHAEQTEEATTTVSTSDVTASSTALALNQEYTNKNSYVNTRVAADVRKDVYILHALINAAVYGSGNATARLYTDFTPSVSGSWDVAVDYFRKASIEGGAKVTFSVFKQSDFGGVTKKSLEEATSTVQGNKTRSASLDLTAGTDYNLGFEIRSTGTASGLVTFGDAYNNPGPGSNRRRAVVEELRVRRP